MEKHIEEHVDDVWTFHWRRVDCCEAGQTIPVDNPASERSSRTYPPVVATRLSSLSTLHRLLQKLAQASAR